MRNCKEITCERMTDQKSGYCTLHGKPEYSVGDFVTPGQVIQGGSINPAFDGFALRVVGTSKFKIVALNKDWPL